MPLSYFGIFTAGEAAGVSTAVQDVTGVPPRSFQDFAKDYRHAFLD
jgi:hypothetical protein